MVPAARAARPLDGRVALVTGGGRGIGRAIAHRLALDGACVIITWNRDAGAAEDCVAAIAERGGTARAYHAAMEDRSQVVELADAVLRDAGPVDILVHNAGITSRGASIVDSDPAEFERQIAVNCLGATWLTQQLVPHMRTRARGDVVVMSTVAASLMLPNAGPYAMAKSCLEVLAMTIAKEERAHGIRANIVAPGLVATEMGDRLTRAVTGGALRAASDLDDRSPYGHVCRPEDVAGVVAYLVSADAAFVTGQRVVVDGGVDLMT